MATRQDASTGELVVEDKQKAEAGYSPSLPDILHIKVWSPFKVYYDAEAKSISGVNNTGPFDILPRHKNFITLLNASDLVVQGKEGEIKIRISGGVMQVHRNNVVVFLEV